ncbi:MAG: hypothetical protein IPH74_13265 [Bacteroidetes bacterium]|nr:hypothetical protein [Bacteroidota bacterium]
MLFVEPEIQQEFVKALIELEITEREAAFEEIRSQKELNWNTPCKKCNSTSCTSLSYPFVNYYKKEIFEEWKYNEKLHFYCQDEDIILADIDNLDNILEGIDNMKKLYFVRNQFY